MIYLASPYSHPNASVMARRFEAACNRTAYLLNQGYHVFSPVVHSHPIATAHQLPRDIDFWRSFNLDMIARCDYLEVLALPGWTSSKGVSEEISFARECGMAITHCIPFPGYYEVVLIDKARQRP